ncbi:hypothetical protein CFB46_23970 [Burkholderia sp. HI2761]|nr:hypothetical protein CFB46_23970 [Burkholderia sp. HI2761]
MNRFALVYQERLNIGVLISIRLTHGNSDISCAAPNWRLARERCRSTLLYLAYFHGPRFHDSRRNVPKSVSDAAAPCWAGIVSRGRRARVSACIIHAGRE